MRGGSCGIKSSQIDSSDAPLAWATNVTSRPGRFGVDVAFDALNRRQLLALSGAAAGALVVGGVTRGHLGELAEALAGDDYGPLGPADALGVRVPKGFTAVLVGRSGDLVATSAHRWHDAPDGGACFAVPGGTDHVYVSNAEVGDGLGGVSAVRFDARGQFVDAYPILSGTSRNCAGGATPWGTWMSCEEYDGGQVWECDPLGGEARHLPGLGTFRHEAAAVDSRRRQVFLTEDDPNGRLYRFRSDNWPSLASGVLEAAVVTDSVVSWMVVRSDRPDRSAATAGFDGGEGIVVDGDWMAFATKGDHRIWQIDLVTNRLSVFHDCLAAPATALTHVDNLAVHPITKHLFVAEDGGNIELCMLTRGGGSPKVTVVVRFEGHDGSEVAGPAFSPDGNSLYVSSQRGRDGHGLTVRIDGPWVDWITAIDKAAASGHPARRFDEVEWAPVAPLNSHTARHW